MSATCSPAVKRAFQLRNLTLAYCRIGHVRAGLIINWLLAEPLVFKMSFKSIRLIATQSMMR